jgi:hypothetical protein
MTKLKCLIIHRRHPGIGNCTSPRRSASHQAESSLSWWLSVKINEEERHKQKLTAPAPDAWNNQMYKVRVLDQLVYDNAPRLQRLEKPR